MRYHAVDGGFHQFDRRQHVGVKRLDPVAAIPIAEIARGRTAGIVDENIRIGTGGENGVPPLLRRNVGGDGHRISAGDRADFIRRAFEDFAPPCNHNELYTFSAQGNRAGFAQTMLAAQAIAVRFRRPNLLFPRLIPSRMRTERLCRCLYLSFGKTMPFIVDAKASGVTIGKNERRLGLNGTPNAPVYLENVKVPVENRVGEEGDGFKTSMRILDMNRPTIGAVSVGRAQGALDAAVKYARERRQFGKAIAEFQGLQFMLADMAMNIEAARSLVYDCAGIADAGFESDAAFRAFSAKASMAKCFASDMAMKVTTDAVQIFGGAGYMKDFPVERFMRDAKINQIFEGTNQIHRLIVARQLLS